MKNLKLTIGITAILFLLINFTACKKDGNKLGDEQGNIDLTPYYIVGKIQESNLKVPYVITFDANAKANSITIGANRQSNYTYKNGTLTLDYGDGDKDIFKIDNDVITSFQGTNNLISYSLQKVPATNQLSGNTYSGGWASPGSNILFVAKFKFNAAQYGEASLGDPVINKDYTLIKNVAATSNIGANGTLTFFAVIDGKLEGARFKPTSANGDGTFSYGTFAKQ